MVRRLMRVGTVLALLGGSAAFAAAAKPKLIVRGVFRLDPATGEYQRNLALSEEIKKYIASQAESSFEVELENNPEACGARSEREKCFADALQDKGWASVEINIGISNNAGGVDRAPIQIYGYAPNLATSPGAQRKALSVQETPEGSGCVVGRGTAEQPSECETFMADYLKDWLLVSRPQSQSAACRGTASKGRTIGGVISLILGAGGVAIGGYLLNAGLQPRWLPDGCELNGKHRQFCQTYANDQIAGGAVLLGVGVAGIATGAGLLLSKTESSGSGPGGENACRK